MKVNSIKVLSGFNLQLVSMKTDFSYSLLFVTFFVNWLFTYFALFLDIILCRYLLPRAVQMNQYCYLILMFI